MKFDDFLAQAHVYPVPWAWGIQFEYPPDFKAIWRHTIYTTKAEAVAELRKIRKQKWVREDGRMTVVRVYFEIKTEP